MCGLVICVCVLCVHIVCGTYVALSGDERVVIGGTGQFRAELFDDSGNAATGSFVYTWQDNAVPQHFHEEKSTSAVSYWNITYPSDKYAPGPYNIQIDVKKWFVFVWEPVTSQRMAFNVTFFLNGDLTLSQGNQTRRRFVSSTESVNHEIFIASPDEDFLNKTEKEITTYWFIDCVPFGETKGLNFVNNYTDLDAGHYVEAFVVAAPKAVIPPPTIAPTTVPTTPATNGTSTTTVLPPSTTKADHNDVNTVSTVVKPAQQDQISQWLKSFPRGNISVTLPRTSQYCLNTSVIPLNINNTYGYFRTNFTVKAPIKIYPMNGTSWLMDGSILNITLSCNGSAPYQYCVLLKSGLYNVTGDETCSWLKTIRNCTIRIEHLFKEPAEYTVVVILSNEVSKVVKPIAVNVYKVTKHAQLSVIIVPVTFSFVAVVLIIFGVAYYLQSRRSYTIEVANFDFGNQANDMEYKTFRERLKESVTNSFFKSQDLTDSENVWSPSRKYGSMQ